MPILVGYNKYDFNTKDGDRIVGYKLHFNERINHENGDGFKTESHNVNNQFVLDHKLMLKDLINKEVELYFDQYNKIKLIEIKK